MTEFSALEAYADGMLDTGDGNLVYWQCRGNPAGRPALIVHGGPGSGMPSGTPRSFDPERFRIILFDQRGCGRSTPHAADPRTDMSLNTTRHLLADMELLREHLGVDRWLLFGGSWGSALAVAYAERHPDRVSALVLPSFWLMRPADVDWLYRGGVARLFPADWAQFRAGLPSAARDGDPVAGYVALMEDADPAVRARAALAWVTWEDAVLSLEPSGRPSLYSAKQSEARLAFVRICARYAANAGWLDGGELLRDADRLNGIPGVIVHGRLDLSCPLDAPWSFARAWTTGELVVVDDAGHKGSPEMTRQVRAAIARLAG